RTTASNGRPDSRIRSPRRTAAAHLRRDTAASRCDETKARRAERSRNSRAPLHDYSCAIAQHFRDAIHYLGGVIANAHNGVCTQLLRVREHQFKRLPARLFTKTREERDVAADERLQRAADGAEDGSRAHHDPPDDAKGARDFVA